MQLENIRDNYEIYLYTPGTQANLWHRGRATGPRGEAPLTLVATWEWYDGVRINDPALWERWGVVLAIAPR